MIEFEKVLVTGGAGFIGSNLVDRLLEMGKEVVVLDNLSTGHKEYLSEALEHENFTLVVGDVRDTCLLDEVLENGIDFVFHLAANADVRFGIDDTSRDFMQNTEATLRILQSMEKNSVKNIAFSSTGSVYGEAGICPTPENYQMPIQTSFYGASKLSAENFIHAFVEAFSFRAWVFRFVSILGPRYSHGHVFDFIAKLKKSSSSLEILGDGEQTKSYLHVSDCIDGMLVAIANSGEKINTYNLGLDEVCTVNDSASHICEFLNVKPEFKYSGGRQGWIGDNPKIQLDAAKLKAKGWKPKNNLFSSITDTCAYLTKNDWLFDKK